jgi:hypothetical protein
MISNSPPNQGILTEQATGLEAMTNPTPKVKYLTDRGIFPDYQDWFQEITSSQASHALGYSCPSGGFWIAADCMLNDSRQIHPDIPLQTEKGPRKWLSPKAGIGSSDNFTIFASHPDFESDYCYVTEGVVKGVAIHQLGHPCIPLHGVSMWSIPGSNPRVVKPRLLQWLPQKIYLAFDSDYKSNKDVLRELIAFGQALCDLGKEVFVLNFEEKGIDDELAAIKGAGHKIAALANITKAAKPLSLLSDTADGKIWNIKSRETLAESWKRYLALRMPRIVKSGGVLYSITRSSEGFNRTNALDLAESWLMDWLSSCVEERLNKKGEAKKCQDLCSVNNLRAIASATPLVLRSLVSSECELDSNPNKIRFTNGVFDLRTNEFDPESDYLSISVGYPLIFGDAQTLAPTFFQFLQSSFGHLDSSVIIASMRFLMDAGPKWDKLIHITGESGTGKGVYCNLVTKLMGHFSSPVTVDGLISPDKIQQALSGRRLAVDSDADGALMSPTTLYKITSQEPLPMRLLNSSDQYTDRTPRRVLIGSISPLRVLAREGASGGLIRRVIPLETRRTSEVPNLDESLELEMSAIAGIVLGMTFDRAREILTEYLTGPDIADKRSAKDTASLFLEDHVEVGESGTDVKPIVLYQMFQIWSRANGFTKIMSKPTFDAKVRTQFKRISIRNRHYEGVRYNSAYLEDCQLNMDHYNPHR